MESVLESLCKLFIKTQNCFIVKQHAISEKAPKSHIYIPVDAVFMKRAKEDSGSCTD